MAQKVIFDAVAKQHFVAKDLFVLGEDRLARHKTRIRRRENLGLGWSGHVGSYRQVRDKNSTEPTLPALISWPTLAMGEAFIMAPCLAEIDRENIASTYELIRPYIRRTPVVEVEGADFGLERRSPDP